eukprot:scaffold203514_cov32-Tisochrysis_lutea.AAC.4
MDSDAYAPSSQVLSVREIEFRRSDLLDVRGTSSHETFTSRPQALEHTKSEENNNHHTAHTEKGYPHHE